MRRLLTTEQKSTEFKLPAEREVGVGELSMLDDGWLSLLRQEHVTEQELELGNKWANHGSTFLSGKDITQAAKIDYARERFYGEFLKFDRPENAVHAQYTRRRTSRNHLPPCSTFIAAHRLLYRKWVNGLTILDSGVANVLDLTDVNLSGMINAISSMGARPALVLEKVPSLTRKGSVKLVEAGRSLRRAGFDSARIVESEPTVLNTYSEKDDYSVRRLAYEAAEIDVDSLVESWAVALRYTTPEIKWRFDKLYRFSSILSWYGSMHDLTQKYPGSTFMASHAKVALMARIFAEHGDKKWTPSQVNTLACRPVESHTIVLALGLPYGQASSYNIANDVAPDKVSRKNFMRALLDSDEHKTPSEREIAERARERIGSKILRAYRRYADRGEEEPLADAGE